MFIYPTANGYTASNDPLAKVYGSRAEAARAGRRLARSGGGLKRKRSRSSERTQSNNVTYLRS